MGRVGSKLAVVAIPRPRVDFGGFVGGALSAGDHATGTGWSPFICHGPRPHWAGECDVDRAASAVYVCAVDRVVSEPLMQSRVQLGLPPPAQELRW